MNTKQALDFMKKQVPDPKHGLPKEIFLFVSGLTPMVNVDLLIKDEKGGTLLSWRDDKYAGRGWHLPGGIIRFKEKIETRVKMVAETEIGTKVSFDPAPLAINQVICSHNTRGHFISILYKCSLSGKFNPENIGLTPKDPGYLKWHSLCPANLVPVHNMYKGFIKGK